MNYSARTPKEVDTVKTQKVIKTKRNKSTGGFYVSNQNKSVQKMLIKLDPIMFREVDTVQTQEVINIDIE